MRVKERSVCGSALTRTPVNSAPQMHLHELSQSHYHICSWRKMSAYIQHGYESCQILSNGSCHKTCIATYSWVRFSSCVKALAGIVVIALKLRSLQKIGVGLDDVTIREELADHGHARKLLVNKRGCIDLWWLLFLHSQKYSHSHYARPRTGVDLTRHTSQALRGAVDRPSFNATGAHFGAQTSRGVLRSRKRGCSCKYEAQ